MGLISKSLAHETQRSQQLFEALNGTIGVICAGYWWSAL